MKSQKFFSWVKVILFSAVFIMYVIMIVYRYVLNKTVFQMAELCQVLYLQIQVLHLSIQLMLLYLKK